MKSIPALVWIPAVFIIGGLAGYYGPSEELRAKELRAKEQTIKQQQGDTFGSFTQMMNIPRTASRPSLNKKGKNENSHPTESSSTNAPIAQVGTDDNSREKEFSPEDLKARIDEACELWRARVEMVRAATIERLGLSEEQERGFDAALESMNSKLKDSMQAAADEISLSETFTPELGVRLMGDLSMSLAEAYDEIGDSLGEGMREEVSKLQLIEFVDPSVGEPLIAVQDKIYPQM